MALKAFYNEIKGLKVKDLPAHLKPYLNIKSVKNAGKLCMADYRAKYIETNSGDPIYHVCFGGTALSYLIALPKLSREHERKNAELWKMAFDSEPPSFGNQVEASIRAALFH